MECGNLDSHTSPLQAFLIAGSTIVTMGLPTSDLSKQSFLIFEFGTAQNSLYYMAGGEEKFFQKNLLAPYEIIVENTTAQSPFP